jgi:O6-methylguanine-DNA--protein-cysteine methyltransferase
MRSNKDSVAYPCYKVVGSDGSLVGYSGPGGLRAKREMLERDGVEFRGEKVDLSAALFRF